MDGDNDDERVCVWKEREEDWAVPMQGKAAATGAGFHICD